MKSKKIIAIAIISLAMIVVMTACFPGMGADKCPAYDVPSMDLFDAEVTAESVTIIPDKYYETHRDGEVLEYRLENGDWQDSPTFGSLIPNTDYTIGIRVKEDKDHKASDCDYLYVTTSKKEAAVLPEKINYTQENRTITIEQNDAWEYCFWGDDDYRDGNSYTYNDYDNGTKTIKVRVKATDQAAAGEPYEIKVYISGYYGGQGTEEDPFLIYTKEHFTARDTVSSGYNRVYFKLMSDLDFVNDSVKECCRVNDVFDGNGHKISNVKITQATTGEYIVKNNVGIFPEIHTVKNLVAENVDIQLEGEDWNVSYSVGLIAGYAQVIENCRASGSIVFNDAYTQRTVVGIGGLAGEMGTTQGEVVVNKSFADVKIRYSATSSIRVALRVGGLFGASSDMYDQTMSVSGSMANVDIDVKGFTSYEVDRYSTIGGLVGDTKVGSVENCYATGKIKANIFTDEYAGNIAIGGLTGATYETYKSTRSEFPSIKHCYSTVNIDVEDGMNKRAVIGGINPMMKSKTVEGKVENCLFAGSINITDMQSRSVAGSVYGRNLENMTISDCFHIDNLADYVDVNSSMAVDETTLKSVSWQRDVLGLSEDVWKLVDGSYPVLK